ncbi:hypothetical protein GWK47_023512 [Chionoecetes opilio]|uniref:Uncharacterized protein n=1 Tax=Chionoecetes opilio TaxID=41210 RepID=A0A8J4XM88_CHIOP|nr:hypothetical protein GWK47_023512 [Chionoecetes opilio]
MTQGIECLRGNTWPHQHLASHPQGPIHAGITGPWRRADVPAPTYNAPPPWGPPAPEFTATRCLPVKPCAPPGAAAARADGHWPRSPSGDSRVYFMTARSTRIVAEQVPRSSPRVGQSCLGGVLTTAPHSRLSWWPSSTPFEHALHRWEATVVIHTDSWTGPQALNSRIPRTKVRSSPPS